MMVQKRRSQLESVSHAAEIAFAKNIFRQVVLDVDFQEGGERAPGLPRRGSPVREGLGPKVRLKVSTLGWCKPREPKAIGLEPGHLAFSAPLGPALRGSAGTDRKPGRRQVSTPTVTEVLPRALVSSHQFIQPVAAQNDLESSSRVLA